MKNTIRTINILIINHLFDVIPWKYFSSSVWAACTLRSTSATLASILLNITSHVKQNQGPYNKYTKSFRSVEKNTETLW